LAFAVLEADGSITAWGNSSLGGTAPSGSGYTKIYSGGHAFVALKADGSITAWGSLYETGHVALDAGVVPPKRESPHAAIEPSALTAAKALPFE
jgi:hypothetical protein